jgi:hypothetical protein
MNLAWHLHFRVTFIIGQNLHHLALSRYSIIIPLHTELEAQLTQQQVEAAQAWARAKPFEAAVDEVLKQVEITSQAGEGEKHDESGTLHQNSPR